MFGWCRKKETISPSIPRPSISILVDRDPQSRRSSPIVYSLDNTDRRYFLPPINMIPRSVFGGGRGRGFVSPRSRTKNSSVGRTTNGRILGCFKCISSRASFPPKKISMLAMVIVIREASLLQMHLGTARPGWMLTLGKRVQSVPCGTLIPGMMGDGGGLHHLYLRLHVVLDADEVRCRDLGSMVRDLHGWHMWDLNVEGLGVWGWNSWLLRNLEHLVDFRSMYLRNFSRR